MSTNQKYVISSSEFLCKINHTSNGKKIIEHGYYYCTQKKGYCYMTRENFHTFSRLTKNKAIWPFVILCSPTEDSR